MTDTLKPQFVRNARPAKPKPQNGKAPEAGESFPIKAGDRLLGTIPNFPPAVLAELHAADLWRIEDLEDLADRQWDGNVFHALRSFPKITEQQARAAHSAIGIRPDARLRAWARGEVPAPAPEPVAGGHASADDDEPNLVRVIPLKRITTSPLNPRKHFDEQKIAELALSIRSRGVLSPIVVRPHPRAGVGPHAYELVAGERRFRAAAAAGLEGIPAMVKRLSDKDALEVMVIENEQREDVGPLEKAAGYHELTKLGVSPEEIARRVGKSESTIRRLLKLRHLPEIAAKAVTDGVIQVDTADQIARIPGEKVRQKAALKILAGDNWWDREIRTVPKDAEPMSSRQAREFIHRHCMVELKGAPFSRVALDLVPAAGSCDACPKRVGNLQKTDAEGYSGIRADVCCDPDCYRAKVDAHAHAAVAAARAAGCKVISQQQAERDGIFDWHGELRYSSEFVKLSQKCFEDPKKRTYEKLVGEACAQNVVVAIDKDGNAHRLLPKAKAGPALKAAGVGKGKASSRLAHSAESAASQRRAAAERAKQEAGRIAAAQAQAQVVEKAERIFRGMEVTTATTYAMIQTLVHGVVMHTWHDARKRVAKRRQCTNEALEDLVKGGKLSVPQLLGLAAEMHAAREAHGWGHPHFDGDQSWFFDSFGVDKAALMQAAAAEKKPKRKKVKS